MKIGYSLIDFDVVFPIQTSEFIESLNFGCNLKKKLKIFHFPPKIHFIDKKYFFNWK